MTVGGNLPWPGEPHDPQFLRDGIKAEVRYAGSGADEVMNAQDEPCMIVEFDEWEWRVTQHGEPTGWSGTFRGDREGAAEHATRMRDQVRAERSQKAEIEQHPYREWADVIKIVWD